jgi:hypothetical protein
MRYVPLVLAALIALTAWGGISITHAQAPTETIAYNIPREGEITGSEFEQTWTFTGTNDDRILIEMQTISGTLIPEFEVLDLNEQSLGLASADESGALASREYILTGDGAYTIRVGRQRGTDGVTTGNYRLTVTLLGAGNPSIDESTGTVELDGTAEGELSNAQWREAWDFTTESSDVITIRAERRDGTVRPELILLDGSGVEVRRAYIATSGDYSELERVTLPGPGSYRIVVQREGESRGVTSGRYTVTLTVNGTGEESSELFAPISEIEPGSIVEGEITDRQWTNVYSLTATSQDRLQVTVTRTGGNLMPMLYIFGANNQELTRSYTSPNGADATLTYSLPGTGDYTIRVGRVNDKTGATQGTYELVLTVLGTGSDSELFTAFAGEATTDEPVSGTLTNVKWLDSWTFEGDAETYTFEVIRTSGTLRPRIAILDASGQEIRSAYPENSGDTARLVMQLPGEGEYTVVVFREYERDGVTRGGYELRIREGQPE